MLYCKNAKQVDFIELKGKKVSGSNTKMSDYVHYVKVVPSGKYSDKDGRIICLVGEGVPIPYGKCKDSI